MTGKQIEAIKQKYPKFSKEAASIASRPEETGVILLDDALKIARSAFLEKMNNEPLEELEAKIKRFNPPKKRDYKRAKPNRLVVRLKTEDLETVEDIKHYYRLNTQDYLEALIKEDIEKWNSASRDLSQQSSYVSLLEQL